MRRMLFLAVLVLVVHLPAQAAEEPQKKPEVVNRIRAGEPMPGQMKRKGTMKESVHDQAMKKDALMREAMKKEAPARATGAAAPRL